MKHRHRFSKLHRIYNLGEDYRCSCGEVKTIWKGKHDLTVHAPEEERASTLHGDLYYTARGFGPKKIIR